MILTHITVIYYLFLCKMIYDSDFKLGTWQNLSSIRTDVLVYYEGEHFILCFFLWYMYVNSFLDVSVHFKSKTNLLFIRERIIIPVYVYSLSECAMRCFCQTKCISFFNENFDLFCQRKGKSYVSFKSSSTDPWIYCGNYHFAVKMKIYLWI